MHNDERDESFDEAVWDDVRQEVSRIEVPLEKFGAAVQRGMQEARQRRARLRRKRMGASAASLLLLASLLSIRYSPVVAAYAGDIPGLDAVVHWIRGDKGIELAIANDFMQPIGLAEEHGGVRMTIDGLIADESRMVIFYTIEDGRVHADQAAILGVEITDGGGLPLREYGLGYGTPDYGPKPEAGLGRGTIDITFQEGAHIPTTLQLRVKLETEEQAVSPAALWNYAIPIDRSKFEGMREVIDFHRQVTIEDQRITFGKLTVLPTRIALEVAYDPSNTKHIFEFDDLELVDEEGNVFGTIANGVSGTFKDEHHSILYFQSNYFMKPKELYLRASSMKALDKNKLEVLVDLENEALLTKPDDRLSLTGIAEEGNDLVLRFNLANSDPRDALRGYSVFSSQFHDSAGVEHHSSMSGFSTGEKQYHTMQYHIPKGSYVSPIKLTIDMYPTRIEGDILLRVK
jgi:hypothetical protein